MLTVLTPIIPGEEDRLTAYLTTFTNGNSPFAAVDGVHVARCVVVGQVRHDYPGAPRARRRLRMNYLLFTAVFDGTAADFLRRLRESMLSARIGIWAHCVGSPDLDTPEFERYLQHNALPIRQRYAAYDTTVDGVRHAMDLRRRHQDFAAARSGRSPARLLDDFCAEFGVVPDGP